ncbi:MAG: SgcJ/EcaC family oxidoreductase [Gemmatimonadota bacterium]
MERRIYPLWTATFIACLIAGPQSATAQDAKAEVTAAAEKMEAAFNARDAATLTSLYAESAIVMPPGSEPMTGHDAIRAMWDSLDENAPILDLKTRDVMLVGDLAVETGGWSGTFADGTHADHGSYLAVWKKTDAGWKMIRDTWNSSMTQ